MTISFRPLLVDDIRATALRADDERDLSALQGLHERCAEFIELIEHAPPGPDAAHQLLVDLPPGRTLDDKLVIGFWDGDALIGAADLVRNHPTPGTWCVGLLLLDASRRNGGLGARLFAAVEAWLNAEGAASLHLCVQEQNPGAERFWARQGFARGEQLISGGDTVTRMRKSLRDG